MIRPVFKVHMACWGVYGLQQAHFGLFGHSWTVAAAALWNVALSNMGSHRITCSVQVASRIAKTKSS